MDLNAAKVLSLSIKIFEFEFSHFLSLSLSLSLSTLSLSLLSAWFYICQLQSLSLGCPGVSQDSRSVISENMITR